MSKFEVHEVDTKKERKSRLIKRLAVGGAVAVLVAGAAASWWYFTPPALPTDVASAKAVLESPRFQRLSKAQKQPYYDVIREQFGSLDPDQRRELMQTDGMRDMWRGEMDNRLRAFALADEAARQKMIEEGMAMMNAMRGNRPPGERPEGERPPRDPAAMRDRMSDRLANGNPQNQAIMGEIMKRIREQREREQPR